MTDGLAGLRVRRATVTLLALCLAGCGSSDETVEVYVPLHRLQLPEKPFRQFTAGPAAAPISTRVSLTESQSQTAPDPEQPMIEDAETPLPIVAVEFYPVGWLGLGFDYADYGEGAHGTLRVKAHLLSPPPGRAAAGDASLAITFAVADKGYDAQGSSASTSLQSETRDYALIAGWRAHRWLLFYGGPFNHRQRYDGTHSAAAGGSPSRSVVAGVAELTGFNAGLSVNPGVRWMSVVAEYSSGQLEAGASRDRVESVNAALRFNFGGRLDPAVH